ncbi:MarC Multiple antibiotic transporter [Burkholderiales bacterium]
MEWTQTESLIRAAVGLFVIVDPIGSVVLFLAVTRGYSTEKRKRAAQWAGLTVAGVLIGAALIGRAVLDVFSIRLASLSVAGGILFLILAIQMLNAEPEPAPDSSSSDPSLPESAIVPLGVPLMAGPGAISTVILNSPGLADPITTGLLILAIAGVGLSTWLCFTFSDQIVRLVGPVGIRLLTRLMGLVLAALAIEYIAKGLAGIFPKLFGT